MFCYDNKFTYPVYLSDQKFELYGFVVDIRWTQISLCVYQRFWQVHVSVKLKIKVRNIFVSVVYSILVVKNFSIKHRTDCLVTNGKQSVKLKSSTIKFKNYFKQLPVPFKIYADFECILKKVKSDIIECDSNSSYTRKCKDYISCSLAYKVVCLDNKFSKKVVLYSGNNDVYKFMEPILNNCNYCRKVIEFQLIGAVM